ncbi:MAG: hypothetical protein HOW73_23350 [Polyangiaceae bacterium]|nr:hypothetical protein [Polyangiaceae bacterium]
MKLTLLFAAMLVSVSTAGCLARGGAAGLAPDGEQTQEEDEFGPAPPASTQASAQAAPVPSGTPGQMDVAWEDNGIPIRQLTGPGAPQEMKLPEGHRKMPVAKSK